MGLPTALVDSLVELTRSVDLDDSAVVAPLAALVHDAGLAVLSYRGLRLVLLDHDHAVTLSVFEHPVGVADCVTSLRVPLDALSNADPGSSLTLYAGLPGAFVDLSADLSYALGLADRLVIVLDADLPPLSVASGIDGLAEGSTINRAVGLLIERGHEPADAHRELGRLAASTGATSFVVAGALLRQMTRD